tara:strand:- start:56 stop:463 length:408 start_codon:yes stop_codon:yes gene_type:complete
MTAVTYSQNPKRLSLIIVILGILFIFLSLYLSWFEDPSYLTLLVGAQLIFLYFNMKRDKYSIKLNDREIAYDLLGINNRVAIANVKNLEIRLFEIHIQKDDGETDVLSLDHIKDRELKKIKSSFNQLKQELFPKP